VAYEYEKKEAKTLLNYLLLASKMVVNML
jgi:hypothetical protein